jgi:hypothetical protein
MPPLLAVTQAATRIIPMMRKAAAVVLVLAALGSAVYLGSLRLDSHLALSRLLQAVSPAARNIAARTVAPTGSARLRSLSRVSGWQARSPS